MLEYVGRCDSEEPQYCCKCHRLTDPRFMSKYLRCFGFRQYDGYEYVCYSCESIVRRENAEEAMRNSPEYQEELARRREQADRDRWDDYYADLAYEKEIETNYNL